MTAVRTSLLASIERAQPGLIGEFARVARSGDPAAIRSMLERATNAVNDAAVEMQRNGFDGTMFANIPSPSGPYRPNPMPRPKPQLQQGPEQLFANIPNGPYRPNPIPRPKPQLTSPQLAAQPAWALLTSQLFTEQLAASMALKLEHSPHA